MILLWTEFFFSDVDIAFCGAALSKQSFPYSFPSFFSEKLWESLSLWCCDDPGAGEIPSGVFAGASGKIHCLSFPTRWENEAANSSLWTEGQLIIVDGGHITWNIYMYMTVYGIICIHKIYFTTILFVYWVQSHENS